MSTEASELIKEIQRLNRDEFVNRKYLTEHVFHGDEKTTGRILKLPGFPVIVLEGMNPRYSVKEVERFMKAHQIHMN